VIDDRVFERLDGPAVGRPELVGGRTSITLAEGMTGTMECVFPSVKNCPKTMTAEIDVPAGGGNCTVIAQGGRFTGRIPRVTIEMLQSVGFDRRARTILGPCPVARPAHS
jgi:hypothetical protein